jgi:sorbitol/mannitol transport system permease protein
MVKKKRNIDRLFLYPAVIVVAVVTQVPFVLTIIYSLLKWKLTRPDLGIKFAGLSNYIYYLKRLEFWQIIWQTIELTVIALIFCTVLGILLSLLLDHSFPGVNIARTLILGPFFVMSTVTGIVWKTTIFNTSFGWYGVIMKFFGLQPPDLLSTHPIGSIALLFVWQWTPFFVLVILAGLQSISEDVIDSMKIDGVNWIQGVVFIKIPMIMTHLAVAVMLGLVFLVKEFALILTTTAGGPGKASYTLPYDVYMIIFSGSDVGKSSAVAAMTVILFLAIINIVYKFIKKRQAALS